MKLDSNIINLNSFELRSKRAIKPKEWAKRCQKAKRVSWFVAEWSFMQFHIILDCYYLDIVGQKVGKTRDHLKNLQKKSAGIFVHPLDLDRVIQFVLIDSVDALKLYNHREKPVYPLWSI